MHSSLYLTCEKIVFQTETCIFLARGSFQEEQAETSAENVAFWAQEFQSVIENTQSDTTTLLLDIENIVSDVGGEHREIQQLLDQEKAELNGLFTSLTEMADQVVDNAREQKAQMGPIEREELDGILKTTTAAAKAKNDIKAKALAAQNTAEKLLQEEKDDVVNDLEGQIRDFRGDANEVDKTNQEKADQLVATAKEITTDFRDEILATRKANAEVSIQRFFVGKSGVFVVWGWGGRGACRYSYR